MPVVVMLGRQGSGKGTQCSLLASAADAVHLSTGDLLRREMRDGTAVGRRVTSFLTRGELVPDELMVEMLAPHLQAVDGRLLLLDGFPRTQSQARLLDALLGGGPDLVVDLFVPRRVAEARLRSRRVCASCGSSTSSSDDACPRCGGRLEARADDTPEAIARRLALYDDETAPVLDHYAALGRLATIDATGPAQEVAARVAAAVAARDGRSTAVA